MWWSKGVFFVLPLFFFVACSDKQNLLTENDAPIDGDESNLDLDTNPVPISTIPDSPAILSWVENSMLDFGERELESEVAQSLLLVNEGGMDAQIRSISSNNPIFTVQNAEDCVRAASGETCVVEVQFKPTQSGSQTALITVAYSDGEQEQTLIATVSGEGADMSSSILIASESQFVFGDLISGQKATRTVQLRNNGDSYIELISIEGLDPKTATAATDCPTTIPPGENCQLTVTFNPLSALSFGGSLVIQYRDTQEEKTLSFTVAGAAHDLLFTGAGPAGGPHLRAYHSVSLRERWGRFAYSNDFGGGIFVGAADIDGDGVKDAITGAGAGGGAHVRVFNGLDGTDLRSFLAYDASFTGGIRVAGGDTDGDGRDEILTVTGPGMVTRVRIYRATDNALIRDFEPYGTTWTGGAFIAAGDVNEDGTDDIILGADAGGGPHVIVFNGKNLAVIHSFYAFDVGFTGGVAVSSGDFNQDGKNDVIVGAGVNGGPHVKVLNGTNLGLLASFFAFDPGFTGGVNVGAVDANRDGTVDLMVGARAGGGPHVRVINGKNFNSAVRNFYAYEAGFRGGVTVAGH